MGTQAKPGMCLAIFVLLVQRSLLFYVNICFWTLLMFFIYLFCFIICFCLSLLGVRTPGCRGPYILALPCLWDPAHLCDPQTPAYLTLSRTPSNSQRWKSQWSSLEKWPHLFPREGCPLPCRWEALTGGQWVLSPSAPLGPIIDSETLKILRPWPSGCIVSTNSACHCWAEYIDGGSFPFQDSFLLLKSPSLAICGLRHLCVLQKLKILAQLSLSRGSVSAAEIQKSA